MASDCTTRSLVNPKGRITKILNGPNGPPAFTVLTVPPPPGHVPVSIYSMTIFYFIDSTPGSIDK